MKRLLALALLALVTTGAGAQVPPHCRALAPATPPTINVKAEMWADLRASTGPWAWVGGPSWGPPRLGLSPEYPTLEPLLRALLPLPGVAAHAAASGYCGPPGSGGDEAIRVCGPGRAAAANAIGEVLRNPWVTHCCDEASSRAVRAFERVYERHPTYAEWWPVVADHETAISGGRTYWRPSGLWDQISRCEAEGKEKSPPAERGVGYSPPLFAVSKFLRSDGASIRQVRWPMDLTARPWPPGAPPGTPPVDYDAYFRRYGVALTSAVASREGVTHGKLDWAVDAAPHGAGYQEALEWACRQRPGLLGRATTGEWDCRATARELEDSSATGAIASIYAAWRVATGTPPPPPGPPLPVPPPPVPPPPVPEPPPQTCPEICPSKSFGWPQCAPCPCPEGVVPGPRPWGRVHCTPGGEEEEEEEETPPAPGCVEYRALIPRDATPDSIMLVRQGEVECPEEMP